jgi:hypothetical protein
MTRRSINYAVCSVTATLALFTSACFSRVDLDIAQRAAEEFHLRVSKGQADAIYDEATGHYRMSISRELNRSRFARVSRKMGACPTSVATSIVVNSGTRGKSVTASYQTTCSAGVLDESFLWQVEDGKARLDSYDVNSPLLLGD